MEEYRHAMPRRSTFHKSSKAKGAPSSHRTVKPRTRMPSQRPTAETLYEPRDPEHFDQNLRETAAHLLAVLNTAVDGIITIDDRGRIESFNPAAEKIFGYTAQEVIGRNISVLMPQPYRQEHDTYLQRYLQTGRAKIIGIGREVAGQRKDGTTFPMDLSVGESRLGVRRFFTGIIRDISQRKRAEREILRLQHEVAQRSALERQRIGRDLHDGLGQELTNIAFRAKVLEKVLAEDSRPQAAALAELVGLINQAIEHSRALVKGLCPVLSEREGLISALRELASATSELHGLRCRLTCPRSAPIHDTTIATELYYIASEAVNNAVKHARARKIGIHLDAGDGQIKLVVSDDGKGLPPRMDTHTGRGLRIMHHRAQTIGGRLEVGSAPGKGTTIACLVKSTTGLQ